MLNGAEMVGTLSILLAGFLLVRADAITLGAATAAAFYFTRLFSPLMIMLYLLDGTVGWCRAGPVGRDHRSAGSPASIAPGVPRNASMIISGVRFGYDDGPEVLHGIDLELAAGERVAVVGATGAGKTTLGMIAAGVRQPDQGEVRIGGVPLADLADQQACRPGHPGSPRVRRDGGGQPAAGPARMPRRISCGQRWPRWASTSTWTRSSGMVPDEIQRDPCAAARADPAAADRSRS